MSDYKKEKVDPATGPTKIESIFNIENSPDTEETQAESLLDEIAALLAEGEKDEAITLAEANGLDSKEVLAAFECANAEEIVKKGEEQYANSTFKHFDNWYIIGDDGTGEPKAVNKHSRSRMAFGPFARRMKHLPPVPVLDGMKVKYIPAVEYWWSDKDTERFDEFEYDPNQPESWETDYGESRRNEYVPHHKRPAPPGDPSPYLTLLEANLPDERDQWVLLSALAHAHQKPGERLQWCPVFQGVKGCGKGLLVEAPLQHCIGLNNYGTANIENLGEDFNGYAYNKTVLVIDEGGDRAKVQMKDVERKLRQMITQPILSWRIMRRDAFPAPAFFDVFMMTNHPEALMMYDPDERRYAPLVSAMQSKEDIARIIPPSEWWKERHPHVWGAVPWDGTGDAPSWFTYYAHWQNNCGGAEAVRHMLETYQHVGRVGRAPETTATAAAIAHCASQWEIELRESIAEGLIGFRGGFVSGAAIKSMLEDRDLRAAPKLVGEAMSRMGYVHKTRLQHGHRTASGEYARWGNHAKGLITFYYKDASLVSKSPAEVYQLYEAAQKDAPPELKVGDQVIPFPTPDR